MGSKKVATEVGNDEVQSLGTTPDQENKREDQNQDFNKFGLAHRNVIILIISIRTVD